MMAAMRIGLVMMPIMMMPWLIVPVSAVLVVMMTRAILRHRPVNMLGQDHDAGPFHITYGRREIIGFAVDHAWPADRYMKVAACHGCA